MSTVATIETHTDRDGSVAIDFKVGGATKTFTYEDKRPLQTACQRAGEKLHAVAARVPYLPPSVDDQQAAMRMLVEAGNDLGLMLADDAGDEWHALVDMFARAWPVASNTVDAIPVVQVAARDVLFPFELLPLLRSSQPTISDERDAPLSSADRFLGFGAVVRRIPSGSFPAEESLLRENDSVPLQFLRYRETGWHKRRKYRGFDEEPAALGALGMNVEGPWPDATLTLQEVRARLVAVLYDPRISLDGSPRDGLAAQVQHFACHCNTKPDDDRYFALRLSSGKVKYDITLDQIRGDHLLAGEGAMELPPRALIVMNACASSRIDPRSSFSLPKWFLQNRHPAFVGTLTDVPDPVAAAFTQGMYRFLLTGRSLGESLVLARRHLLIDKKSPLGLLYVLYGNDLLRVSG